MSLDEFYLWQQFEEESPLPDMRSDFQTAHIVSTVMNMAGKSMKKQISLSDVLLFQPQEKREPVDVLDQIRRKKGA